MKVVLIPGPRNEELIAEMMEAKSRMDAEEWEEYLTDCVCQGDEYMDAMYYICENGDEMLSKKTVASSNDSLISASYIGSPDENGSPPKDEMTVKQLKRRKRISESSAFLLSVLPVSAVILSKWRLRVESPGQAIAIGAGGIMVGVVIILSILGRLKIPGDLWVWTFSLVLLVLLQSVIGDLILLNGAVLGGRIGDKLLTATYVKRVRKEIEDREAAERAGKTAIEAVKEYLGGDRI